MLSPSKQCVLIKIINMYIYAQGNEAFRTVAVGSDRDTGYTREIKPKGEFTQRQEQVTTVNESPSFYFGNLLIALIYYWFFQLEYHIIELFRKLERKDHFLLRYDSSIFE